MSTTINNFLDSTNCDIADIVSSFEAMYRSLCCLCPFSVQKLRFENRAKELLVITSKGDVESSSMLTIYCNWLLGNESDCFSLATVMYNRNCGNDVFLSVLGTLRSEINSHALYHSKLAVQIFDSVINNYVLASNLRRNEYYDLNETINAHDKLFVIRKSGTCAYKPLLNLLFEKQEYVQSLPYYRVLIYQESDLTLMRRYYECLVQTKNTREALAVLEFGFISFPDEVFWRKSKVSLLYQIGEYERAFDLLIPQDLELTQHERDLLAIKYVEASDIDEVDDRIEYKLLQWKLSKLSNLLPDNSPTFISGVNELLNRGFYASSLKKNYFQCHMYMYGDCQEINEENNIYRFFLRSQQCSGESPQEIKLKENIQKMNIFSKNSKLVFGKYKGRRIDQIATIDGGYLLWCLISVASFVVDDEVLFNPHLSMFAQYSKALEFNFIKQKFYYKNIYTETIIEKAHEDDRPSYDESLYDALGGQMEAYWNID